MTLACRVFGHRPTFWAEGTTLRWSCVRDCGHTGEKDYRDVAQACRYAVAFNREDSDQLGRRSLISLLPLRLARRGEKRSR